jgi:hypothetical protein
MQMSWDAVSAVGEAVSAIAVVVSLLYLAVQVRQTNQQAQASAESDWMTGWNLQVTGLAHPQIVSIVRSGLSDFASLQSDEKVIFQEQMAALTNQWVLGRNLYTRGLLPTELYRGATSVLVSFYSTPGGLAMLEQTAPSIPRADELLEAARRGSTKSWTDQFPWWSAD